MRIRIGYVANALGLWDASPSKALTFTRYKTLSKQERKAKLLEVTAQNLINTKRILYYNWAHEVKLYRFSSSLVPLATHPEVMWDFRTPFKKEWKELGQIVKKMKMRPSFHPSQYTLFTSPREEVTQNAIKDMEYHFSMIEAMGIEEDAVLNIHIGGAYGDKETTLVRFHENLKGLPQHIKNITTLENDDKTYNVIETLQACERENIPMLLDYHHHMANQGGVELPDLLERIFDTWNRRNLLPKVHISSPKSEKEFRPHADFVDLEFVMPFLLMAKELGRDFDIMIEAKKKDLAMQKFVEDLSTVRRVKRKSSTEVEW